MGSSPTPKPIVIDCPLCGHSHAKPDPPGGICGWCLEVIEPGTEHYPTEPCCSCTVVRAQIAELKVRDE